MLAKQKGFECRDKPGKFLAKINTEKIPIKITSSMYTKNGLQVMQIEDEFNIFPDFYKNVYRSLAPSFDKMNSFLDRFNVKQLSAEHKQLLDQSF